MASVSEELDSFYRFAELRLEAGEQHGSLDELYSEWRLGQRPPKEFEDDVRAIQASIRDMNAGETGRPVMEFVQEFRQRNGI